MSLSTLGTLPEEIILQIASGLTSNKDLSSFGRVSKALRRISQPLLYNDCEVEDLHTEGFLRTILIRPDLAKKVKCLQWTSSFVGFSAFKWSDFYDNRTDHAKRAAFMARYLPGTHHRAAFDALDGRVNVTFQMAWLDMLATAVPDYHFGLLLFALPAIESLCITIGAISHNPDGFFELILGPASRLLSSYRTLPMLGSLKSLQFVLNKQLSGSSTFRIFAPLLAAPALETFTAKALDVPDSFPKGFPTAISLKHIYFDDAGIKIDFITQLLHRCPDLLSFNVHISFFYNVFDYINIAKAFHTCATFLTALTSITITHSRLLTIPAVAEIYCRKLCAFASLTHLDVPEFVILGPDPAAAWTAPLASNLPPNIASLKLSWCTSALVPHLRGVRAAGRAAFPALAQVSAAFAFAMAGEEEEDEEGEGRWEFLAQLERLGDEFGKYMSGTVFWWKVKGEGCDNEGLRELWEGV